MDAASTAGPADGRVTAVAGRTTTRASASSRSQWILLAGVAALLAAAVALQFRPIEAPVVILRQLPLADYFPRNAAGWHGEDQPLGATEAELGAVHKILNFDEAVFRTYRRDDRSFSLYVAYWRPGKMPAREVDFHVPDVCWVMVGWKKHAADYHFERQFEGRWLAPAQYREFDDSNGRQYVIFWHILDGRAISYSADDAHNQMNTLGAVFRMGLDQRGEQYFIRLSSGRPFEEVWNDEGFQEILELTAALGPGLQPAGPSAH